MGDLLPQAQWKLYALDLGQRVKVLRCMRGLTQARLAEISGVSRSLISNLERNDYNGSRSADPTISTVYRLAAALYVPPAVLLPSAGEVYEGSEPAADIDVELTLRWPAGPRDTARFAEAYLRHGADEDVERF